MREKPRGQASKRLHAVGVRASYLDGHEGIVEEYMEVETAFGRAIERLGT